MLNPNMERSKLKLCSRTSYGVNPIPGDFTVELRLKQGGSAFSRPLFFNAVTKTIAKIAKEPWNEMFQNLHFDPEWGISFDFTSGRTVSMYQTRSMCWTLAWVFFQMVRSGNYAEAGWISRMSSNVIGFGKVYSAFTGVSSNETENAVQTRSGDSLSRPGDLDMVYQYTEGGSQIAMTKVYGMAIHLMLDIGHHDASGICTGASTYEAGSGFTLAVSQIAAGGDDLTWSLALDALWMLPEGMNRLGQWSEVTATLRRSRGSNLGRLYLLKGQIPLDQLESVFNSRSSRNNTSESTSSGEDTGGGDGSILPVTNSNGTILENIKPMGTS